MVATHVSELAGVEQGSKSHIFFFFLQTGTKCFFTLGIIRARFSIALELIRYRKWDPRRPVNGL